MKVVSSGPLLQVVRRSVSVGESGLIYNRDDWNTGRRLGAEEQRSGILLRLSDVGKSKDSGGGASPRRLEAVVKGQSTDFHVNQVLHAGKKSCIEKCPKGRWRKISRSKTILVDHQDSRFSDPDRPKVPLTQSLGEYVPRVGKLPPHQPVLEFALFRDGYSMESTLARFRYVLGVSPDALVMRETPGGHYGCTTQTCASVGVTKELLPHVSRHYNLHAMIVDPKSYHGADALGRFQAAPAGYAYRVLLRCVTGDREAIRQNLQLLSRDGFINYYGVENFGVCSSPLFDMNALASAGEYSRASGTYLQLLAETNPRHFDFFSAYLRAEPSTSLGAADAWMRASKALYRPEETTVLRRLCELHAAEDGDSAAAHLQALWESIPAKTRKKGARAAAMMVWNAMASQRLSRHGRTVVKGDLVCVDGDVHVVDSDEAAAGFSVEQVVLPVPFRETTGRQLHYPDLSAVSEGAYRAFASRHRLGFLFDPAGEDYSSATPQPEPVYRPVVAKPKNLQASILVDPSSLTALKSDLFLLQERKPVDDGVSLNYDLRVREPSPYNVSERFAQRMQPIRAAHGGGHSVALSFLLGPDSSPLSALREPFDLVYAVFHDLTTLS